MTLPDFTLLNQAGLNLQAIFNIDELPGALGTEIHQGFDRQGRYRQLILIGHGGKRLWRAVKNAGIDSENPIDDFTIQTLEHWFANNFPQHQHRIVYPGQASLGLQALGKLAGWHHASPFMVGINEQWGSWYAYRAVILTDTDLAPSVPQHTQPPCAACSTKACLSTCPADALSGAAFDLKKCITYRKSPDSACKATCLARLSCPVGSAHRYDDEQIRHTYSISMQTIERHY